MGQDLNCNASNTDSLTMILPKVKPNIPSLDLQIKQTFIISVQCNSRRFTIKFLMTIIIRNTELLHNVISAINSKSP